MSDRSIEEQGANVVSLFLAVAASPDDLDTAIAADDALAELEVLLSSAP